MSGRQCAPPHWHGAAFPFEYATGETFLHRRHRARIGPPFTFFSFASTSATVTGRPARTSFQVAPRRYFTGSPLRFRFFPMSSSRLFREVAQVLTKSTMSCQRWWMQAQWYLNPTLREVIRRLSLPRCISIRTRKLLAFASPPSRLGSSVLSASLFSGADYLGVSCYGVRSVGKFRFAALNVIQPHSG